MSKEEKAEEIEQQRSVQENAQTLRQVQKPVTECRRKVTAVKK